MSLPDLMKANENYGTFQIYDKTTQNDAYGGYMDVYVPGATFEGMLVLDDSINAQVAESQGVTGIYTLTFSKALRLPWHTVFKKTSGERLVGMYFRVTSKDESATPRVSGLDLKNVKAEEFVPGGVSEVTDG